MMLADTTVLIDIARGRPSVQRILEHWQSEPFCISAITLMELYVGLGYTLQKYGESQYRKQKDRLDAIIHDFDVLPLSRELLQQAGLKKGRLFAQGITVDMEDVLIGVTAEQLGARGILTRNGSHFTAFDVKKIEYPKS